MPDKLDPELAREIAVDPDAAYDAVVTSAGSLEDLAACLPPEAQVVARYRLLPGVALRARGHALRGLALEAVVKSIEPVRDVSAC